MKKEIVTSADVKYSHSFKKDKLNIPKRRCAMKKFRIIFAGHIDIPARNEENALEKFEDCDLTKTKWEYRDVTDQFEIDKHGCRIEDEDDLSWMAK